MAHTGGGRGGGLFGVSGGLLVVFSDSVTATAFGGVFLVFSSREAAGQLASEERLLGGFVLSSTAGLVPIAFPWKGRLPFFMLLPFAAITRPSCVVAVSRCRPFSSLPTEAASIEISRLCHTPGPEATSG